MIRANKLGGGTSIKCIGVANNYGANTTCATTNPTDLTDTHEGTDASSGSFTMALAGGFGNITSMGLNPQSKGYINITPTKSGKCFMISLNSSTTQPQEISFVAGTMFTITFSGDVGFILY